MHKIIGLILLALLALSSLPYLLYWLLWLVTGRGLPPKSKEHMPNLWRPEQIWALRAVGITAIGVGLYRATLFLWARQRNIARIEIADLNCSTQIFISVRPSSGFASLCAWCGKCEIADEPRLIRLILAGCHNRAYSGRNR
jgi:hypothetical protein